MKNARRFLLMASVAMVAAAVVDQLRKHRQDRDWNGRVAGLIR